MAKCNVSGVFTRDNLFKYARNVGVASYAGLGIVVSQPSVVRAGHVDPTNTLLAGSLLGTSVFLYGRPHLNGVPTKKRVWLSIYGSGLFNLGSLLIWAIVKTATQELNLHPIFRGFLSLAASYYMVLSGLSWVDIIDNQK
ncbi:unnamed protein product [Allacma fusca]|uniref:Uncharacterized protein n=1 Tax=Allacma fusca TaxID=39272 RepID=A0A8J2PZ75_9HEXA|nr:unnamed protein product [Allacma fusca]